MRSTVELALDMTRTGDTRVSGIRHEGAVAARVTGTGPVATVHLIGTAAGPMSGDTLTISMRLAAGARLRLRSTAASLALPGPPDSDPGVPAMVHIDIDLAAGTELDMELQPTIVTARARLAQRTVVAMHADAGLRLREHLVSGRHDEPGGAWVAAVDIRREGLPVLRQSVTDCTAPARTLTCGVDIKPGSQVPEPGRRQVHGGLWCGAVTGSLAAGGWTTTAWGPDLTSTRDALDHLDRAAQPPPHPVVRP